jgi:hypothetical protein
MSEAAAMTTLPADEDYARAVLAIFQARNVKPPQSLRVTDVKAALLAQNMGSPADFDAALEFATGEGWLALAFDRIRLTVSGAEEMQTVVWPLRGSRTVSAGSRAARD